MNISKFNNGFCFHINVGNFLFFWNKQYHCAYLIHKPSSACVII